MYTADHFSVRAFVTWTRRDSAWLLAVAVVPTLLYVLAGWHWLALPWVPIALLGTASAFTVGFRNNATYARLWEARQIYGAIVNASRSWGLMVRDLIVPAERCSVSDVAAAHTRLIHRHIAWLTALRYQLRQPRSWETMRLKANIEFRDKFYRVEEQSGDLQGALAPWLTAADLARVMRATNRAAHVLVLQGEDLAGLRAIGAIEANAHVALEQLLATLLTHQGACERIKNFPYPRQFATINLFFIRLFAYTVPLGLLGEFARIGPTAVWLTIPFGFLIGWVFNAMERVGQATENPFEGSANDVPITALSRTIEIDLREMLGEADIPAPLTPVNDVLM